MISSYFLKNSTVRVIAFTMNVGIALVMTPFITSVLGKAGYGGWALISSVQGYLGLLDLGVMNAMSRHGSAAIGGGDADKLRRLFSTAFFLNVAAFCVAAAVVMVLPALYRLVLADALDEGIVAPLSIFGGLLIFTLLGKALQGVLMAHLQWTVIALVGLARSLLVAVALYLWLTTDGGLSRMAWINGVGLGGEALLLGAVCLVRHRVRPRLGDIRWREAREVMGYGLSILVIGVGDTMRYRTQGFVVGRFHGLGEVAHVSIALQFINYFNNFMLSAFGIMTPYFARLSSRSSRGERLAAFRGAILPCVLSATFVGLSLVFYGDVLIARWLGPAYGDVHAILVPFALGSMFFLAMMPANALMLGVGRHAESSRWSVAEGAAVLTATLALVPRYGAAASGWAYCLVVVVSRLAFLFTMVARERAFTSAGMLAGMVGMFAGASLIQTVYFVLVRDVAQRGLGQAAGCFLGQGLVLVGTHFALARLTAVGRVAPTGEGHG